MMTIEPGDWLYVKNEAKLRDDHFLAYVWSVKPDSMLVEIYGVQFHIPLNDPNWEFWKI